MLGLSRSDGSVLSGRAHIEQSVGDILSTRLVERKMRPQYGSDLFDYVDRPQNGALKTEMATAAIKAIKKWEPRLTNVKATVRFVDGPNGRIAVIVEATIVNSGETLNFERVMANE